jgi:hypothetical protein
VVYNRVNPGGLVHVGRMIDVNILMSWMFTLSDVGQSSILSQRTILKAARAAAVVLAKKLRLPACQDIASKFWNSRATSVHHPSTHANMGKKRKAGGRYGQANETKEEDSKLAINTYEDVADSEDEFLINRDKILLDEGPAAKKLRKWKEEGKSGSLLYECERVPLTDL